MIISILQFVAGMILLGAGGSYLVRGATKLALWARISTTVVALTVVAMGTSLPELAVSLGAGLRDSIDIAYGNIIGSNIFNIGAILGIGAVVAVIPVQRQTVRHEYSFMLLVSTMAAFVAWDGRVNRVEGVLLLVALALFTAFMIHRSRRDVSRTEESELREEVVRTAHADVTSEPRWGRAIATVVFGMIALALGADLAVRGAIELARYLGVQERIIGLTVVAMGTSLPELATTIIAIRQNQPEMALGNVIGSNIFNLLGILGVTAVVVTVPVNREAIHIDLWVMLAFSAAIFPSMFWLKAIRRWEGVVLLVGFVSYMSYLVTHATIG
jgi:cation:H+ antiporter